MASLVQLTNGLMLWNVHNREIGAGIAHRFYSKETAIIVPTSNRGEFSIVKLSEDIGKPEYVEYPETAFLSMRQSLDEELNTKCRAVLSGLVLAK